VVLADLQIELAEEVAKEINTSGDKARAVKIDVANFPALEQLVQETVNRTGRIDYMFNNAGIAIIGSANHYGIEDWNYITDVNLSGVINGIQAVYNVMISQGFGHIVNTASVAGLMLTPGMVSYSATKHAVVGLSKSLRVEAANFGIRVSVFCPGFVRTAIFEGGGKYGRMLIDWSPEQQKGMMEMVDKYKPMDPNTFAEKALQSVAKNKAIIVVPSWWKLFWWIHRLFPTIGTLHAQKFFQDMQKRFAL
jgi:short-subunit dehydrogenase